MIKKILIATIIAIYSMGMSPSVWAEKSEPKAVILTESGDLQSYLLNLKYNPPYKRYGRSAWRSPTRVQASAFVRTMHRLVDKDYSSAAATAEEAGFVLVKYYDTKTDHDYYVLREIHPYPEAGSRAGGTYVFNPNSKHNIAIEAPHAVYDYNTPKIAIPLFFKANARWFIVTGTHRQGSKIWGGCDHMSSVSTRADAAHNIKHFFFAAHYGLTLYDKQVKFVQIHGMYDGSVPEARETCYTTSSISSSNRKFLIVSKGGVGNRTHLLAGNRKNSKNKWRLVDHLYHQFSHQTDSSIRACFYDQTVYSDGRCDKWKEGYCPYTNIWGANQVESRITNNPDKYQSKTLDDYYEANICTGGAPGKNSHRFIHIEASATIRNSASLRKLQVIKIAKAINDYYVNKS